jgi:dihydropteroate synthase
VINLTPNSFSTNQYDSSWRHFFKVCDAIDVGAESTAPSNEPISSLEEIQRLKKLLFPHIATWPENVLLSVDTYHLETMEWFLKETNWSKPIIWNDISGILDGSVKQLLATYPNLQYVLNFTFIPERELSGRHRDFIKDDVDIVKEAEVFFKNAKKNLITFEARVIFDPGFGFSKNRIQNQILLKNLTNLMGVIEWKKWLWAISRKSFLRWPIDLDPKNLQNQKYLDGVQLLTFHSHLKKLQNHHEIFLRVHDPDVVLTLKHLEPGNFY